MKALVTGGAGFIGGAVVRRLLQYGYDVVVVDNMSDPTFAIQPATMNKKIKFYAFDVRNLRDLYKATDPSEGGKVDIVFHFAAHYANERSLKYPLMNVDVNMRGTMAVLEVCRLRGIRTLVYASSSGVYGALPVVAYAENAEPRPSTPYEVTKYAGELLCDGYCGIFGINLIAPRLFNVYGCGDMPGEYRAVVPNFFRAALNNETIKVMGKSASRDFTYIDDAVNGIMAGVKRVAEMPDRVTLVYNVGTGSEVFIKKLAEIIVQMTSSQSNIEIIDKRFWDNAPRRVADTHKFRALFPRVEREMRQVEQGLADSLDWYCSTCK